MAAKLLLRANWATKIRLNSLICHARGSKKYTRPDHPKPDPEVLSAVGQPLRKLSFEVEKFPAEFSVDRPKGRIYDKKPFKIELEEGKRYSWCTCGRSKNQPLCDGSHKQLDGTNFNKAPQQYKFRPLRFVVEETKDYWLCNCKQTGKAPFCDGTHRRQDIQDAIKS